MFTYDAHTFYTDDDDGFQPLYVFIEKETNDRHPSHFTFNSTTILHWLNKEWKVWLITLTAV